MSGDKLNQFGQIRRENDGLLYKKLKEDQTGINGAELARTAAISLAAMAILETGDLEEGSILAERLRAAQLLRLDVERGRQENILAAEIAGVGAF